ncbi:cohesin domain-containing protein [Pseudoalteromonas sp. OOF1S-7]|uniref:cohesin domain-containing protein n=1 Tax=Pseudoalteromonas sp. OOF1S-7 TaxID=2917757 RepID=UPI001EF56CAF|nr:cohesin domain-containing protein [Pseudoalteromonas sp. OOF1S-7]MCG7534625.1 cohesin domain-containing protein [Pseudoalteromonas sp. OOF1S-7]
MNYIVCITALLFSLSAFAEQGRIYLETSNPKIKTGSEFYVDVIVDNLPEVYGVQLTLNYDAKSVTFIDQDAKTKGTQLEQGNFLDEKLLYTLRNQADPQTGQIQYIASQVAPAQSAAGSGRLARLYFSAPANTSETKLSIQVAEFGTRNGEKYTYTAQAPLGLSFNASYQVQSSPHTDIPWAIVLTAVLLLLSILSAFYIRRRPVATPDSQPA